MRIVKQVQRALLGLVGVVAPVVIAACYGVQAAFTRTGRVLDATTKLAIPGIKVTCLEGQTAGEATTTDTHGNFSIHSFQDCTMIRFDDVDGAANGGPYQPTTIPAGTGGSALDVMLSK